MEDQLPFCELQRGVHSLYFLAESKGSLRYIAVLKSRRLVSLYSEAIDLGSVIF